MNPSIISFFCSESDFPTLRPVAYRLLLFGLRHRLKSRTELMNEFLLLALVLLYLAVSYAPSSQGPGDTGETHSSERSSDDKGDIDPAARP